MSQISPYFDLQRSASQVRQGDHRTLVGGMWDEVGPMQIAFLRTHGLQPTMRVLDVGCGCLRGGVHIVEFLNSGNYYGIDISQDLLDAGYDVELAAVELRQKMPRENLLCTGDFDARPFGVDFDFLLAQSVFTHLTLNHMIFCLTRLEQVTRPGSRLFATIFLAADRQAWAGPVVHAPGGITTHPERNPYHVTREDLMNSTVGTDWRLDWVGDWEHPRNQSMAIFTRT